MSRIQALQQISREFNGGKLAKKLTEAEFDEVVSFIEDHDQLPHLEFEYAVNRWKLDIPVRPKNLFTMHELALSANTRAHGRTKEQ